MAKSADKNKVQINIIGDNVDLDESLQDSEAIIDSFGKRAVSSIEKVAGVVSELKDELVTTFLRGADALAKFTFNIKESTVSLSGFQDAWERTRLYFESIGLEVRELILNNRSLAKTIELTGKSAGYSAQSLQEYADYLEKTTKFSADATKSAMQLITHFRNIHGEQFLAATKAAQDLATELRTDLNSAAQLVGESLNDPIEALKRLNAVNVFFTASEEKAIKTAMRLNKVTEAQDLILKRLVKSFGGAAKEAGETFFGKLERLRNVLHSVGTKIGEAVYNKINKISEVLFKNKNIFDALIEKISHWGDVAITIVDSVTESIANFVIKNKGKFLDLFNWLIDQSIKVAITIPQVFTRTVEIISALNTFVLDSFVKTWNGISKIFTDILPASYKYMKDVFTSTISTLTRNGYIFWLNFKEFAQTALHNIWVEFLKLKTRVTGWLSTMLRAFDLWKKGIITTQNVTDIFEFALGGGKGSKAELVKKLVKNNPKLLLPQNAGALVGFGLGAKSNIDNIEKQVGALDSYKKEWKSLGDLLNNLNLENPLKGNLPTLQGSLDLTKEWNTLLQETTEIFNRDFDNVDTKVAAIRKKFDAFVNDVKSKASGIEEPKLNAENKRREDEKRNNFANKMVSGLEEFWYKGQSEQEKNTHAIEENTKTLKQQREEREKQHLDEKTRLQNEQKQRRRDYLVNSGRMKSEEQKTEAEKLQQEKREKLQQRIYGISDRDIDRLKELQNKEKQARARGDVLSHDENNEIRSLEARKRSREVLMGNIKNRELRENERRLLLEKARNARRLESIENRRKEAENRRNGQPLQQKKEKITNFASKDMKSAVKEGNKDAVSELQQIAKNTARFADIFSQVGAV